MSAVATTARDIAMKGGGYYSKATGGAKDVIDGATTMVLDAIADMEIADDGAIFTMSDMGCADGGTSMSMVGKALAAIRAKAPSRPLQMVYTDLPRNDFSQVFCNVHGLSDAKSYIDDFENLFVMASGTSFHKRIFPAGTLNLGFSATASHYISDRPCNITNHVHMVGADGAERAAYTEQGRKDWESMLSNRAADMASGARLCLFNFGIDEEGRYLGHTGGVSMFDTFSLLWQRLVDEGAVTNEEFAATNFPQHYRTVAEFKAPLIDEANPVHQAGLRLSHAETRVVRCPYAAAFEEHRDAGRFAHEYIPTLRSWSESTFFSGLSEERPVEERQNIVDRFYDSYETMVRESPEGHAMDYVHCYMVIRKV